MIFCREAFMRRSQGKTFNESAQGSLRLDRDRWALGQLSRTHVAWIGREKTRNWLKHTRYDSEEQHCSKSSLLSRCHSGAPSINSLTYPV